jgi:glucan 1,3-beta-glucosidase
MPQLNRRRFIQTACVFGAAALACPGSSWAASTSAAVAPKIRGVNLGGWLVLEKWIKPSLFAGQTAEDEYTLCQALGKEKASALLQKHRETWITADDFKWLASHGINSVRLPVGYWVAEENSPFITGWDTAVQAFRMADENGLSVLLDLHGLPGSQNGWDHSGRQGAIAWPTSQDNIEHSLRVIEDLAARCKEFKNLLGIELVNEPRDSIPIKILKSYYQAGYEKVRKHIAPDRAAVVIHDSFRPFLWDNFMSGPSYQNVILDTHLYQCFSDEDRQRNIDSQLKVASGDRPVQLKKMQAQHTCIVGEWSLGLPEKTVKGLNQTAQAAATRAFGSAQIVTYGQTHGWYFWTYRTEESGGWNFRECINKGLLSL